MDINLYKTCLVLNGASSGSLTTFYDFTGGSGNGIYNSLYPVSELSTSGLFISDLNPGIIVNNQVPFSEIFTGNMSGGESIRVGGTNPMNNFTAMIDYEVDFCSSSGNHGNVLLSSRIDGTGVSGFIFGINQSNKLFFEYEASGFDKIHTLYHEIPKRVSAVLRLSENNHVSLGFYDYEDDRFKSQRFSIPNYDQSDTLYLGSLYNNTGTLYSGLEGSFNNFSLFSGFLGDDGSAACVECLFFTGVQDESTSSPFSVFRTTGYSFNIVSESGITGHKPTIGTVPHPTGGTTTVVSLKDLSGVTHLVNEVGPLTGLVGTGTDNVSGHSQKFDYALKSRYGIKSISLLSPAQSGDLLEIYSYQQPQSSFNIQSLNFNIDKSGKSGALLFHNGILNNEGVDYGIIGDVFTGDVSQGYDPSDNFSYNLIPERIIVTPFSGLWSGAKILLNSGSSGTGQAYYPNAPQYIESGTDILITGISGINLTGYDLFLNGQKMAEDYDYEIAHSGVTPLLKVYGTHVPELTADVSYTGDMFVSGWPAYPPSGITNVQQGTMTFVQKTTGSSVNRYVNYNTGADLKSVTITGFSEQVWLNGIKQIGYDKTFPCDPVSGVQDYFDNYYLFYNNNVKHFNIE
jgi:hypothetical protein